MCVANSYVNHVYAQYQCNTLCYSHNNYIQTAQIVRWWLFAAEVVRAWQSVMYGRHIHAGMEKALVIQVHWQPWFRLQHALIGILHYMNTQVSKHAWTQSTRQFTKTSFLHADRINTAIKHMQGIYSGRELSLSIYLLWSTHQFPKISFLPAESTQP